MQSLALPAFFRRLAWVLLGVGVGVELLIPRGPYSLEALGLALGTVLGLAALNFFVIPAPWRPWLIGLELVLNAAFIALSSLRFAPLLYLITITRSRFLIGRNASYITSALALGLLLSQSWQAISQRGLEVQSRLQAGQGMDDLILYFLLTSMVLFSAATFFVLTMSDAMIREQASREQAEKLSAQLEQANQQLRVYSLQAEMLATAQERNRIAREIHDSLGHYLTAMKVQMDAGLMLLDRDRPRAKNVLDRVQTLHSEALQEVRRSVQALRSSRLEDRDFATALAELIAEAQTLGNFHVTLMYRQPALDYREEAAAAIYRILQEAFTNSRKYAQAKEICIRFDIHGDWLLIQFEDDGVGCDPVDFSPGYGLASIRERAIALGGWAVYCTAPTQGFTLGITLALRYVERTLP